MARALLWAGVPHSQVRMSKMFWLFLESEENWSPKFYWWFAGRKEVGCGDLVRDYAKIIIAEYRGWPCKSTAHHARPPLDPNCLTFQ